MRAKLCPACKKELKPYKNGDYRKYCNDNCKKRAKMSYSKARQKIIK